MTYIDTSVLVASHCAERLSRQADEAIRESDGRVISPLVEVEFCSALALKVRRGELDAEAAARTLSAFRRHLVEHRLGLVPVEAKAYALACDWISGLTVPLRVGDALHLATAFVHEMVLLTADRALARAAARFGVDCRLLA
jgi:predicted nucleic acid-binding protein